jgi:prepilin-type N-terminal cleavage/methylation domain-containing protein
MRRGFTLIELLVVIAIIALLIGILLPALGAARMHSRLTVCGSRLQQIGIGMLSYQADYPDRLPQARGPLPGGGENVIGALFAGKKGVLPYYGIDAIGAERRPLNRYVDDRVVAADAEPGVVPMEALRSPIDRGCEETGVPFPPGLERTDSMYDFIGASYTLNDHALDSEQHATLVPVTGGKMPPIFDTTKTWVVGTHPIYNYQQGGDRGMRWYGKECEANLLYADNHVRTRVPVPEGVVNATDDYTFLP